VLPAAQQDLRPRQLGLLRSGDGGAAAGATAAAGAAAADRKRHRNEDDGGAIAAQLHYLACRAPVAPGVSRLRMPCAHIARRDAHSRDCVRAYVTSRAELPCAGAGCGARYPMSEDMLLRPRGRAGALSSESIAGAELARTQ
jgi:hypothetical protein